VGETTGVTVGDGARVGVVTGLTVPVGVAIGARGVGVPPILSGVLVGGVAAVEVASTVGVRKTPIWGDLVGVMRTRKKGVDVSVGVIVGVSHIESIPLEDSTSGGIM